MMNVRTIPLLALAVSLSPAASTAHAGSPLTTAEAKDQIVAPAAPGLPQGNVTLGVKASRGLTGAFLDGITPFWSPGNLNLMLNTRTTVEDNGQVLSSYGLGARYLVPDQDIIIGGFAYYDAIESRYDNNFNQLGLSAEVLTRWFDARFNYYLPDNQVYEVNRSTRTSQDDRRLSPVFRDGNVFKTRLIDLEDRRYYKRYEGALQGFNTEAGFLIPGLDEYLEVRVLAGYYNYDGPFDKHYEGFKGRLEARFLPAIIGQVEYWDDAELMGGHWTGELSVTLPFSIFNLARGRNPFEGTGEMFRPRKREFRERLSDMVVRSHRVMTSLSDPISQGSNSHKTQADIILGPVSQPTPRAVGSGAPPPTEPPSSPPPNT